MKKTFNFGKIAFYGNKKINDVDVELELKEENGKSKMSICGNIWNNLHTDIICGGQCLDEMLPFFKRNNLFLKLYGWWKKYHLNNMHPECEHQREAGWCELANKEVIIYKYILQAEISSRQNKLKDLVIKNEINEIKTNLTKEERKILKLQLFFEDYKPLNKENEQYYRHYKEETKTLNWLTPKEHPEGLLTKSCPVCGYKYGTELKTLTIPEDVINEIKKIIID